MKKEENISNKEPDKFPMTSLLYSTDPTDLYHLLKIISQIEVPDEFAVIGIARARDVMFREIKNVNPTGAAFCYGEDIVVHNKLSSNINIFSKLLECLTLKCSSSKIIYHSISPSNLISLFELLKSEDDVERLNVCRTLKNIFDRKIYCESISRHIENEFQLFYLNYRTHIGMDCMLDLFAHTFSKNYGPWKEHLYLEIALFFMRKAQIEHVENFKGLIVDLCKGNLKRTKLTLKFIFHYFEGIYSLGKLVLVEIMVDLFVLWGEDLLEFTDDLSLLIKSALSSGHHLLLEEVISIFEVKEIYCLLETRVHEFLPQIFDVLYEISKKYWRRKGKAKLFKNIFLILNMSHSVFEKCLIDYNRRKYEKAIEKHK